MTTQYHILDKNLLRYLQNIFNHQIKSFFSLHKKRDKIYRIRKNPNLVDFTERYVKRAENPWMKLNYLLNILKSHVVIISTELSVNLANLFSTCSIYILVT